MIYSYFLKPQMLQKLQLDLVFHLESTYQSICLLSICMSNVYLSIYLTINLIIDTIGLLPKRAQMLKKFKFIIVWPFSNYGSYLYIYLSIYLSLYPSIHLSNYKLNNCYFLKSTDAKQVQIWPCLTLIYLSYYNFDNCYFLKGQDAKKLQTYPCLTLS